MRETVISIDAMGGDFGPSVTVPAALSVLQEEPNLRLIFVGLPDVLESIFKKIEPMHSDRWEIVPASEVVAMDESPAIALRSKKDSSMRVAIDLVKSGRAQACVSAGNTGALMATARFVLKTLPNIDRPALMTRFPTITHRETRVLDLGANVDSLPAHLMQFAVMGSIVAESVDGCVQPTVGLLNVGEEDIKGNEQVKGAAALLSQCKHINYAGYVEGDAIFNGKVDVIVCDGFVGNVTLKACEGMAKLITTFAKETVSKHWWSKLLVLPALPVLKNLKHQMDPRKRNGASLLGLNGIVIKSHGGADLVAFACAVREAILQVEKNVPERISERVASVLRVDTDQN